MTINQPAEPMTVTFTCSGQATGKMRNELDIKMIKPINEHFTLATDEGSFHGGDATAPPPLALFIGGLTGCIMTQIRAFAKRMDITIENLHVETTIQWGWTPKDRIYETHPKSLDIDISIESPSALEDQITLVNAAKKGCFVEQTLAQRNQINHRIKTPEGFLVIS
ncbi:MAG: OsmC family protein [Aestuariivita sp.]|nr:OsmC family protein [Aestuariivita sp.]